MMHRKRVHTVAEVASAEELAHKLTEATWCNCNGFRVAGTGYLFLNDSTGGDGAQEYAVVKEAPEPLQVESITFGWCNYERALGYIQRTLIGDFDNCGTPVSIHVQTPEEHGRCPHCA